uniref:AB hydrolase-1 domain-containing protein n=1 Tax=Chromera velia CCMP2878 TaxID=1169474 RepID=A0A0G4HBK2_9ALVE|eukprot:Cvel_26003.t1-p1 / transcript=Cvel_26003.t1 / gene=Cvel_26003 / organism=Chromera_velia_CCMP2878 / gene_product=Monoacylglycerol lipase ABHD6, putative / transcript_product=Monoacylglycerol lipase ABHD6, putative / location=Cvel_scaffold3026:79-4531(+) / protein_length=345 / sequence_SO=supercontig / SO=protein_coding / is_pseudo=false
MEALKQTVREAWRPCYLIDELTGKFPRVRFYLDSKGVYDSLRSGKCTAEPELQKELDYVIQGMRRMGVDMLRDVVWTPRELNRADWLTKPIWCFQWDQMADALVAEGFCVVTYDLWGRGHSSAPRDLDSDYGGEGHVGQLHALMEHLQLTEKPKHIIGHSMGGAIAALYVEQHGSLATILSLSLLSPAGLMTAKDVKMLRSCGCLHGFARRMLKGSQEKAWTDDFFEKKGPAFESTMEMMRLQAEHNEGSFEAFFLSVLQFPLFGMDKTVEAVSKMSDLRVLLLWGSNDVSVPIEPNFSRWRQILEKGSCNLQHKLFEKTGHGFYLEAAEKVIAEIAPFVKGEPA